MNIYRIIRGGFKWIFNPTYRWLLNARYGKYNLMSDQEYLSKMFRLMLNYDINWENPKTFNEKMQWLKLNYQKPEFTTMVDKYGVREYVTSLIGKEHVVPLLGAWDNPNDIDIDTLPDQFVMKTTHGSGDIYICRDKSLFDIDKAKKAMVKSMKENYYYQSREWPYKNVKPRVIAEQYMQHGGERNLRVYKVFNFNGEPKIVQVIQNDKTRDEAIDYFDTDWNRLELRQNYPNSKVIPSKPETLEKIIELSRMCSKGFPFLRTDWYEVNGKVYFSEFTFYSDAGMAKFYPESWDLELGNLIDLPNRTVVEE